MKENHMEYINCIFCVGSINVPGPWFHATGEGVTTCELDEETGAIRRIAASDFVKNAIWMTYSPYGLLVATERFLNDGELALFEFGSKGITRRFDSAQTTPGGAICHLEISRNCKTVYAASYLGGVSVHAFDNGVLQSAHQVITYEGSGPNKERQEKSHPHQATVSPDGKSLFVCDLGCDKVWVHPIEGGGLGPAQAIEVAPGSGPRHLVFHPRLPRFYLLGELDAVVRVYEGQGASWRQIDALSALPADFTGTPGGGAIKFHPSGKTVAVSVRGSNHIAVFAVDERGDLSPAARFPTRGKTPRDFAFSPSGRWLLALNQDSDSVVPFAFDPDSGLPTGAAGTDFAIGCPVCAVF